MAKTGRPPQRRMAVLMWLREHKGLHSTQEIADGVNYRVDNVRIILKKLIEQNQVVKAAYRKYVALD